MQIDATAGDADHSAGSRADTRRPAARLEGGLALGRHSSPMQIISKLLGAAVEKILEKAGAAALGKALGPIVKILVDPSDIGGHAFDIVDSLITVIEGQCYLIIWYRTGWEDELARSEIKVAMIKINCPGGAAPK